MDGSPPWDDGSPLTDDAPASDSDLAGSPVEFTPSDIVRHAITAWSGLKMDSVELLRCEPYECVASSVWHVLVMEERGERDDGETWIDGLPKSTLRNLSGRMSFIPRGHRLHVWAKPRVVTRATYFIIDPLGPLLDPELRFAETEFQPRLYFEDQDLWAIAAKLKQAGGRDPAAGDSQYAAALSILLCHELLRINGAGVVAPVGRGGLAGWQRKRILDFIEKHLSESVPIGTLAALAQLSPFHFSRAFKQSLGAPPHRYLTRRRIARAKALLADASKSVTEVGIAVGFAETSAFTTVFRKHTGITPTAYRRSLD